MMRRDDIWHADFSWVMIRKLEDIPSSPFLCIGLDGNERGCVKKERRVKVVRSWRDMCDHYCNFL